MSALQPVKGQLWDKGDVTVLQMKSLTPANNHKD